MPGTRPSASSRAVRRPSEVCRARSRANAASVRIRRSLPSSEGWKVKNGSSIQRREPRVASPSSEHQHDRADHRRVEAHPELAEARVVDPGQGEHQRDPHDRVDRLADDVVVGVAGDVLLGGDPERVRAEGDDRDRRRRAGRGRGRRRRARARRASRSSSNGRGLRLAARESAAAAARARARRRVRGWACRSLVHRRRRSDDVFDLLGLHVEVLGEDLLRRPVPPSRRRTRRARAWRRRRPRGPGRAPAPRTTTGPPRTRRAPRSRSCRRSRPGSRRRPRRTSRSAPSRLR